MIKKNTFMVLLYYIYLLTYLLFYEKYLMDMYADIIDSSMFYIIYVFYKNVMNLTRM